MIPFSGAVPTLQGLIACFNYLILCSPTAGDASPQSGSGLSLCVLISSAGLWILANPAAKVSFLPRLLGGSNLVPAPFQDYLQVGMSVHMHVASRPEPHVCVTSPHYVIALEVLAVAREHTFRNVGGTMRRLQQRPYNAHVRGGVRRLAKGELPIGLAEWPISNMAMPAHVLQTHVCYVEHVCVLAHTILIRS